MENRLEKISIKHQRLSQHSLPTIQANQQDHTVHNQTKENHKSQVTQKNQQNHVNSNLELQEKRVFKFNKKENPASKIARKFYTPLPLKNLTGADFQISQSTSRNHLIIQPSKHVQSKHQSSIHFKINITERNSPINQLSNFSVSKMSPPSLKPIQVNEQIQAKRSLMQKTQGNDLTVQRKSFQGKIKLDPIPKQETPFEFSQTFQNYSHAFNGSTQTGQSAIKSPTLNNKTDEVLDQEKHKRLFQNDQLEKLPCYILDYACNSKAGMHNNRSKQNQDSYVILNNLNQNSSLYVISDGHGHNGQKVSNFVSTKIVEYLKSNKNIEYNPLLCFKQFSEIIQGDLTTAKIDTQASGATLVSVLIRQSLGGRIKLYCSNIGDSRAILIQNNLNK